MHFDVDVEHVHHAGPHAQQREDQRDEEELVVQDVQSLLEPLLGILQVFLGLFELKEEKGFVLMTTAQIIYH